MSLRLLLLLLLLRPALHAAKGPDENLAGEDDKAVPTAVPTPMGDERGPVLVSRGAQAAPSFDLPAFVVTGSGERQALARRQDLSGPLDTSGGLKTSPGEQGAGKDQMEAAAGRESLEALSGTGKPFVAGLRLSGGWQPGYAASAYAAQSLGAWSWSLDGDSAYSEGGPKQAAMRDRALSDQGGLRARLGWLGEDGWAVNAFGRGAFASRVPEPYLAGQTDALRRQAWDGGLDLDGRLLGTELRARALAGRAELPGGGLADDQARADLDLSRRFSGRTGSALLEASFGADSSSQASGGLRRSVTLLRGSLLSRFDAFKSTRLGLGLVLDAASGDEQAFQIGPRLRLDQRLGAGFSLRASADSGLRLSRLRQADGGAGEPWHLPDPTLKPQRLDLDGRADFCWQGDGGLSVSLGGFSQQGEDWALPASTPGSVLAVDTAVRGWRLLGLRAQADWVQGPWRLGAEGLVQSAALADLPGWATYTPLWSATATAGFEEGRLKAGLRLELLGPRQAALDGSLPLDPSADLAASAEWRLNEAWSVFAEGRNLAAQTVQPAPAYPEAAPYAGLGLELRF